MCGIVGIISGDKKEYLAKRRILHNLLVIDSLRGMDSTGAMYKREKGDTKVFKLPLCGSDFVEHSKVERILKDAEQYRFFVGHNRAATIGDISKKNAHPFQEGNITLVHNGTVSNASTLHSLQWGTFDVDSNDICYAIDEKGIDHVASRASGGFALVYHNAKNNTLNIIRNDQRPLWVAEVEDIGYVFASEKAMITMAVTRNTTNKIVNMWQPKSMQLVSVDLNKAELPIHYRKIEKYIPPVTVHRSRTNNPNKTHTPRIPESKQNSLDEIKMHRQMDCVFLANVTRDKTTGNPVIDIDSINETSTTGRAKDAAQLYSVEGQIVNPNTGETHMGRAVSVPEATVFEWMEEEDLSLSGVVIVSPLTIYNNKVIAKYKRAATKQEMTGAITAENDEEDNNDEEAFAEVVPTDAGFRTLRGPNGVYMPVDEFKRRYSMDCIQCGDPLSPQDLETVIWLNNQTTPCCTICAAGLQQMGQLH